MKLPDYERRRQAFRLYVRYRNVSQVSKELSIPTATLHNWKKEETWDEKIAELQTRLQGALDAHKRLEDNAILDSQVSDLKILELLEKEVYEALIKGTIKPTRWSEVVDTFAFTSKERRLITGNPTERATNTIDVTGLSEKDLDAQISLLRAITDRNYAEIPPSSEEQKTPPEESPTPPVEPKEPV